MGKLNLDILYCVICNTEPITPETFPHYGPRCMKYLNKHGRFPVTRTEQIGLTDQITTEPAIEPEPEQNKEVEVDKNEGTNRWGF